MPGCICEKHSEQWSLSPFQSMSLRQAAPRLPTSCQLQHMRLIICRWGRTFAPVFSGEFPEAQSKRNYRWPEYASDWQWSTNSHTTRTREDQAITAIWNGI
jgi:hypothetical protein